MRVQLWSYNYEPEPTGIAPLSGVLARELLGRGHDVTVVAAQAHYPEPVWARRLRPLRERRDGVPVLRLPLRVGRRTALERIGQEASYTAALAAVAPLLPTPDVIVAVSPSFPALAPTMVHARLRRVPWVLWLQDILPDGAQATGILDEGRLIAVARRLERAAYASASHIVVISDSFADNLRAKGVDDARMTRIYNPASRPVRSAPRREDGIDPSLVLTMGNVGFTQNLAAVVQAFEADDALVRSRARFVIAGDGVAGDAVRAAITDDRVSVTGIVGDEELSGLLTRASVALVSQRYEGVDFNVPSKLMNFMAEGLPTVAAVRPDAEVTRLIDRSGGGWAVRSPAEAASLLGSVLADPQQLRARGEAAREFARREFTPAVLADQFEAVLARVRPVARP